MTDSDYNLDYINYLEPIFSKQKSFYKKAKVIWLENTKVNTKDNIIILESYSTNICGIQKITIDNINIKLLYIGGWYSATSTRHIEEFIRQYFYPSINKIIDLFPKTKTFKDFLNNTSNSIIINKEDELSKTPINLINTSLTNFVGKHNMFI